MKKLNYCEGSWFAVPLASGGYAVGVVARMAPNGHIICSYFFGPRRDVLPVISDVENLCRKDAIRCILLGDLGLISGEWSIVGVLDSWHRDSWPIPPFLRRNKFVSRAWRTHYAADDPSKLVREEPVPFDTEGLEKDQLWGYGAVEILMSKLLSSDDPDKTFG